MADLAKNRSGKSLFESSNIDHRSQSHSGADLREISLKDKMKQKAEDATQSCCG